MLAGVATPTPALLTTSAVCASYAYAVTHTRAIRRVTMNHDQCTDKKLGEAPNNSDVTFDSLTFTLVMLRLQRKICILLQ